MPKAPSTESAFVDAILESPEDDGLRLVFSDWLQTCGDPRGELIALQVAHARGETTTGSLAREAELLTKHTSEWLGPLAEVGTGAFERGMLAFFELGPVKPAALPIWKTLANDPRWRTVNELRVGRGKVAHYLALVGSPELVSLKIVDVPDEESAERLGGHARPFEHVEVRGRQPIATLWTRPAFAAVRSVGIYDQAEGHLEPLLQELSSQLPASLQTLSIRVTDPGSKMGLKKLAAVAGLATERFQVQFERQWRVTLDRRTDDVHWLGRYAPTPARLQSFAPRMKRLVITSPKISEEEREAFATAFPQTTIELRPIPKSRLASEMARLARAR